MIKPKSKALSTVSLGIVIFVNMMAGQLVSPNIPVFMKEYGISLTQASLAPMTGALGCAVFSIVAIRLIKTMGPKRMLLLSSVINIAACLLHIIIPSILGPVIGGFILGATIAFGTSAVVSSALEILHGSSFLPILGVILGVGTFGGTAATALDAAMQGSAGWRYAYVAEIILAALCIVLNLVFVRIPKNKEGENESESASDVSLEGLNAAEAKKSGSYKLIAFGVLAGALCAAGFPSVISAYWVSGGVEQTSASGFLTIFQLVAGLMTVISGFLISRLGTRSIFIITFGGFVIGVILNIVWSDGKGAGWMIILGAAFAATIKLNSSLLQLIVPSVFGRKDFMVINTSMVPFVYIGSIAGSLFPGVLHDATGAYLVPLIYLLIAAVTALFLYMFAMRISPYKPADPQ